MRFHSLTLLVLAAAACGAPSDTTGVITPPPPPPVTPGVVTTVSITPSTPQLVVGLQSSLSAVARDGNGTQVTGRTVGWVSSVPAVATVSGAGIVTPLTPGTTVISATIDGVVGTAVATVLAAAPVGSVLLSLPDDATVLPGSPLILAVIVRDINGNRISRPVTITSSNPNVAGLVNNSFRVLGAGTTTVTATVEGFSSQAVLTVREGGYIPITGGVASGYAGSVSVQVPIGSLTDPLALLLNPTAVTTMPAGFVPQTGFDAVPASAQLDIAATIKIVVPASAIAASNHPENFRLHRWDGSTWVAVPGSTIDVATRTVTGSSKALGSFAVIEVN